jgi:hypothetical protein
MRSNDELLVNTLSEMWKTTLAEMTERSDRTNELLRRLATVTTQIVEGKWDGRIEIIWEHEQSRKTNVVEAHDGQATAQGNGGT